MKMATACGLRSAKTTVLQDDNGNRALLVTRFDRDGQRRIAQEDACQVAGLYPASKYRIKTEDAIAVLSDACARAVARKPSPPWNCSRQSRSPG